MRESDLSCISGHVVVTGASGRYLNPLQEREKDVTYLRLINLRTHIAATLQIHSVKMIHHNGLINIALSCFCHRCWPLPRY